MPNKASSVTGATPPHQQAAANLSALIESTEDFIWSIDLDFGLLTFNSALRRHIERHFGTQAAIGKRPEDMLPPDRAALWPPLFRRALAEGPFQVEVPFLDSRTFEMSFNPIVVDGEVCGISIFGKDITEHKKAEESRRFLAAVVESSNDAIHAVDLEGRVMSWNRGAELLLGYSANEIIGRSVDLLVPPGRGGDVPVAQAAQGHAVEAFDTCLRAKSGENVDVSLSMAPIWNAEGNVVGASAIARDNRPRRQFEKELKAAESKYRDIFDGALEGMFQTSPDSRVITANPALAQMFGYETPEEFTSSPHSVVKEVWVDAGEYARYTQLANEFGEVRGFECPMKRKDGSTFWGSLDCRAVYAPSGELLYRDGFLRNITKRKQAEEALRASEESLREAQRVAGIGSYLGDLRTGKWEISDILKEILGLGRDYAYTVEAWSSLIHPEDRDGMTAYFEQEVLGKKQDFDREYRIVRASDGAVRWVHGVGRLEFDAQGEPLRLRGVIRDITERRRADMQLRESELRYRSTFEQAPIGIVHTSTEGRFLRCNARFAQIIGYRPEEVVGMTFQQITAPEDIGASLDRLDRIASAGDRFCWEKRYLRKDGSPVWVRITVSAQFNADGNIAHHIALIEDIDALKATQQLLTQAAEAVRLSEERYRTVFQTSLDPITINRLDTQEYVDVNEAFLTVMGFERDEVIGKAPVDLGIWTDPRDLETLAARLEEYGECRDLEIQFTKKDGGTVWGLMSASVIEIDGVQCILAITRDVSGARAAQDEIRSLAYYDPLTGLANRRLLLERLHHSVSAAPRTGRMRAMLFVDLDNFKTLNDTLGHQTGDLLIQETARRLVACVRDTDTVGRLGGDEFVLMLEDLSEIPEEAAAQARAVGEKILGIVAQPYMLNGREARNSASIGIAVFGGKHGNSNEILQQADIAMYQAKAAGRNTLRFFAPALQAAVNARATLEQDLREAIKAGQFVLYYQPQIDRNRLIGAEALIRWKHPVRNILPPGEFISLAEETGLILPLGKWVLDAACAQIAAWAGRRHSAKLAIAVNISAHQFRQPDFVDLVLSALQRSGANPANLRLELTESILVENVQDVIDKMKVLRSHGLRFSLDDFGTGYSSLAYLKRLPLDQLKIDRTFIRDILTDESSAAIAQTIISLSRAMGLPVIAEGVETEQQREFLTRIGCHAFQGFLFSRPLPLEEFEEQWLSSARDAVSAAG